GCGPLPAPRPSLTSRGRPRWPASSAGRRRRRRSRRAPRGRSAGHGPSSPRWPTRTRPVRPGPARPCPARSSPCLDCPAPSRPALCCPALSCPALSCLPTACPPRCPPARSRSALRKPPSPRSLHEVHVRGQPLVAAALQRDQQPVGPGLTLRDLTAGDQRGDGDQRGRGVTLHLLDPGGGDRPPGCDVALLQHGLEHRRVAADLLLEGSGGLLLEVVQLPGCVVRSDRREAGGD